MTVTRVFFVLGLGTLSLALWSFEVRWIKGWAGLAWLQGYSWSAVAHCLLVAVAAYCSAKRETSPPFKRIIMFVLLAWALLLVSFELSRASLFAIYSRGYLSSVAEGSQWSRTLDVVTLLGVPIAVMVTSVGLFLCIDTFLDRITKWTILYVAGALLMVGPLSVLTIHMLPAANGGTDVIHAVKMGYPAFWSVLTVASAVALGGHGTSPCTIATRA